MNIRDSLNFHTYIEHSNSLLIAADCNLELLKESFNSNPNSRLKSLGLFKSTKLLYAVSLELILKARGLYEERNNIMVTTMIGLLVIGGYSVRSLGRAVT